MSADRPIEFLGGQDSDRFGGEAFFLLNIGDDRQNIKIRLTPREAARLRNAMGSWDDNAMFAKVRRSVAKEKS